MADQVTNTQHTMEEVHQPDPGHADQGNPLLRLDPGMTVWFWLVFAVSVIVFWKFGWKLVVKTLDERQQGIQQALNDAEAARRSLATAADTQQKLIEVGRQQVSEIAKRAEESSQKLADDIREKALQESEKVIEAARIQIEMQKERAISEMKSEVVDLAVSVATKLIQANLDDDLNEKLVKDYIDEIPDGSISGASTGPVFSGSTD